MSNEQVDLSRAAAALEATLCDIQTAIRMKMEHASSEDMVNLSEAIKNTTNSWCKMESMRLHREQVENIIKMQLAHATGQQGMIVPGMGEKN